MAIQKALNFTVLIQGDGTSTSVTVNIETDPVFYSLVGGQSFALTGLNISKMVASSVTNLNAEGGTFTLSSARLDATGKLLTLNFSTAPLGVGTASGTLILA